ncbi:MAG: hypothetical protein L0K86_00190 [Actinomycetia bacterium]|nr:hypothetical protein [Actinomycetes bacterium]
MNRDIIEQVLREHDALRVPESDPDLAAVSTAILIEDIFGLVLSDAEIDPTVLADRSAVTALVARLLESA